MHRGHLDIVRRQLEKVKELKQLKQQINSHLFFAEQHAQTRLALGPKRKTKPALFFTRPSERRIDN